MMAPEHKGSDAGNSDMPQRRAQVLPLRERGKFSFTRKDEKSYAEVAKMFGKSKSQ